MPKSTLRPCKLTVLIVDDELLLAQLLKISLELKGYTVLPSAQTGADALAIAQREQPDVVVIDVRLRKDDGVTVAEQIRRHCETKIIFATGSTSLTDHRRIREFEPYAFLLKPVAPVKLIAILDELSLNT